MAKSRKDDDLKKDDDKGDERGTSVEDAVSRGKDATDNLRQALTDQILTGLRSAIASSAISISVFAQIDKLIDDPNANLKPIIPLLVENLASKNQTIALESQKRISKIIEFRTDRDKYLPELTKAIPQTVLNLANGGPALSLNSLHTISAFARKTSVDIGGAIPIIVQRAKNKFAANASDYLGVLTDVACFRGKLTDADADKLARDALDPNTAVSGKAIKWITNLASGKGEIAMVRGMKNMEGLAITKAKQPAPKKAEPKAAKPPVQPIAEAKHRKEKEVVLH
ncbi:Uncharacterised protein [Candidatus Gugararchaeum adminiculabundum]|nr:Uncharacterised protein [Candidatus Gugararchaeum adminiculabundum]